MSYCAIKAIAKGGKVAEESEYRNAWLGAMSLWTHLMKKYLRRPGEDDAALNGRVFYTGQAKEIWGLYKDERLSQDEKIALACTFDNVLIRKKDMKRVAEALKNVGKEMGGYEVCHVSSWGYAIDGMLSKKTADRLMGVGFYHTSVAEDPWPVGSNIRRNKDRWFLAVA